MWTRVDAFVFAGQASVAAKCTCGHYTNTGLKQREFSPADG